MPNLRGTGSDVPHADRARPQSGGEEQLYAPFRPRAARLVATVLALLTFAGAVTIIIAMPQLPGSRFGAGDQVGTALLATGVCWFIYRQGSVRARPDTSGLRVRNLIHTRDVEWSQIVRVAFGSGDPWVRLDLDDGDTLAVMAIQRADGDRGQAEARRLATLVALHEPHADD